MKVVVSAVFDTETREFSDWDVHGDNLTIEFSGSSYYRIKLDGKQIGTVGGYCPGPRELDTCGYKHISFCFDPVRE